MAPVATKSEKRLFFVFALSAAIYFTQGFEGLPQQGLFYYLKETLGYSASRIMAFFSIISFSWLVKPLIGYLVDNFFTKKIWLVLSVSLDIFTVLAIATFNMPVGILLAVLLFNSTNSAFRDVAVDGIMCVEGKRYVATGKIQSVQWIAISLAGLITGVGGGYLATKVSYRQAFLFLLPAYAAILLVSYFYKEQGVGPAEGRGEKKGLLSHLRLLFQDKKLLWVAAFIFLYKYSPSFGTPLFFIQRDVFKWDKIWIGTLSTISTFCSILGAMLYYRFSTGLNLRRWLWYSVFLGAVTTLSYLYYNPISAVVYDVVYSFIGMFIFLMIMDVMARNSTSGFEATSFAFLCSISNLSTVASNLSGAWLLPRVGLRWLIVISSLTSFLCLPFLKKILK